MRINKKVVQLLQEGFKLETLRKMSENSINYLYTKIIQEQVATKGTIATKNEPKAIQLATKGYNVRLEKREMGEAKKKTQAKNPWAICTTQLKKEFGTSERSEWSKTQLKKYERCVMDVKKGIKEGVNPVDVFIENEMDRMIESYTQPKITKSDLLAHLREDAPTIKPVVKPGKPKDKPTRRDNPFVNPNPKVNPAPKANTETKPVVKPGKPAIKPTRRDNPFVNPNPKVNPPPKAISAKKAKDAIINNIMELINFEN